MAETIAETARLRLRTWDEGDLDEFIRVTNTPAVMRWLGGVWDRSKHDAAFGRIQQCRRDHGHCFWLVERKSDDAILGFCGLKRVNSPGGEALHGQFEVGWRLREDAWGQGFAKEAAIASLDLAFDRFGASTVVALTVAGNVASLGLMKRLGMERRAELDFVGQFAPGSDESVETVVYRIDAVDWPAAKAAALS